MGLVLLTGGVRSGKSRLAVELARRHRGPVAFVATAEARDEEMAARIARHRAERPGGWRTVEEPLDVERALGSLGPDEAAVVDCLTLWVSNLIERELGGDAIAALARSTAEVANQHPAPVVAVTNEVGWGIVPASPLGRRFSDVLGAVNATWAAAAERAYLVVAGRILELGGADG